MAVISPQAFINKYTGQIVDYDGWYGAQCVDAFKIGCANLGIPVVKTPNGWANGYWLSRVALGFGKYFDFITNVNALKAGDWCVWDMGSSCKDSHIGMFVSYAGNGYAYIFSENQGGNRGFRTVKLKLDILGALRPKVWAHLDDNATSPTKQVKATGVAHYFDNGYAGTYYATDALNCRNSGSTGAKVLVTIPKGTAVTCYGYYDKGSGYTWLYAQALVKNVLYTGFFALTYLSTNKNAPAQKVLKVGAKIRIRNGAMQYGKSVGFANKVYNTTYTVSEINGNRVVFKAGAVVMGAVKASDCIVQ